MPQNWEEEKDNGLNEAQKDFIRAQRVLLAYWNQVARDRIIAEKLAKED